MAETKQPAVQRSAAPLGSREPRGLLDILRAELGLVAGVVTTILFFTVGKYWLIDLSSLTWLAFMFV